jgi:hypothetical protein
VPLSMVYRTHRVRQSSGTDKSIGEEWTHAVNRPCAVLSSSTDRRLPKSSLKASWMSQKAMVLPLSVLIGDVRGRKVL